MKTASKNKLPERCVRCDARHPWENKDREIEQIVRGESFTVHSSVMRCKACGFEVLTDEQVDELATNTADAYRERHHMLTSKEIVECRKLRCMSQREFAQFVGVGEASIKRWEKAMIQDSSSDALIREKTSNKQTLSQMFTAYLTGVPIALPPGLDACKISGGSLIPATLGWSCHGSVHGNIFLESRAYQFVAASITFGPNDVLNAGVTITLGSITKQTEISMGAHGTKIMLPSFSGEELRSDFIETRNQEDAFALAA
jgi:putative zinc finger/helix-turn-helix YgiT family protein